MGEPDRRDDKEAGCDREAKPRHSLCRSDDPTPGSAMPVRTLLLSSHWTSCGFRRLPFTTNELLPIRRPKIGRSSVPCAGQTYQT